MAMVGQRKGEGGGGASGGFSTGMGGGTSLGQGWCGWVGTGEGICRIVSSEGARSGLGTGCARMRGVEGGMKRGGMAGMCGVGRQVCGAG